MSVAAPLLWTLPWIVPPVVSILRATNSRSLDEYSDNPSETPLVSVIIPARNERRNIERCLRSVLASTYGNFEVIVVDDHSTDGTGDLARAIAHDDPRARVIEAPPLPAGWFGKQWACASGARDARGELLLFTDADTRHSPDLLPRSVSALRARGAELLTVAGEQEMHSFWERVVQPQMFALLAMRYGGTEHMSHPRSPTDAIANGQYIFVRRTSYDAMDGHASVRDKVAEDMSLAQNFVRAGRPLAVLFGRDQLSTHMYASLSELIGGWRKNIYAGGRSAMMGGALGRAAFPVALLMVPVIGLVPVAALIASALGFLSTAWLLWSAVIVGVSLVIWAATYAFMGASVFNALLYPVGLVVLLYIAAGAVARGQRVEWKDREYLSS